MLVGTVFQPVVLRAAVGLDGIKERLAAGRIPNLVQLFRDLRRPPPLRDGQLQRLDLRLGGTLRGRDEIDNRRRRRALREGVRRGRDVAVFHLHEGFEVEFRVDQTRVVQRFGHGRRVVAFFDRDDDLLANVLFRGGFIARIFEIAKPADHDQPRNNDDADDLERLGNCSEHGSGPFRGSHIQAMMSAADAR